MRKLLFFLVLLSLPLFAYAKDNPSSKDFRIPDRTFEMGFNLGANFNNDCLSLKDIFKETIVLDMDKLSDGFNFNFGLNVTPLYFSVNTNKGWGFGLSTGVDATGYLALSGEMLSLKYTEYSKSELSGAVFASAGLDTYFHIKKLKIKVRPAVFYTVAYTKPDISYTYNATDAGTQFYIDYNLKVFTAFPLEKVINSSKDMGSDLINSYLANSDPANSDDKSYNFDNIELTAMPGFDFSIGFEFPLSKEIGISDKLPILDFDIGLDLINIPIVSSTVKDYMMMSGTLGSKNPIELGDFMSSFGDIDSDPVYGEGNERISRPFRAITWVNWRPLLGNRLLTITPSFGFSLNNIYEQSCSPEFGLKARLDLINMLIFTAGLRYEDCLWISSADLAFNLRAVEIYLGADLRSKDIKNWDGYGAGVKIGLKIGW